MHVSCSNCEKSYDLPDDRLPKGKVISFSCPACKHKISLDLTIKENPQVDSERLVFKPLADTSEEALEAEDRRKKIIKRIDDLPPMPKVLLKARQVLSDPGSSFKDIAKIIETDQAIAAKVLKVANSAYYGLSGMVSSIHQASVVLGYKTLEELITMASSSGMLGKQLKGYHLNAGELWKHSLAVALGSRMIAQKRVPTLEGDAFSVGLIHDAGKLALNRYVLQKGKEIEDFMKNQAPSFLLAERAVLGFDHTEVAHDLCVKWKLPENHISAMRYHHNPEETKDNQLARIVYLANHVADLAGMGGGPGFNGEPLNPVSLKALRFDENDMQAMAGDVLKAVEEITSSLNA
jgi:HD-like signal output (HDOD) protein